MLGPEYSLSFWEKARVKVPSRSFWRWVIVGGVFEAIGVPLLFLIHGQWQLPLLPATLLVAELTTLPRFFVNDRWVFHRHERPLSRLWRYHAACAGSFVSWLSVTNGLALAGVNYIVASLCGTACSVGLAVASNFGWIWRPKKQRA